MKRKVCSLNLYSFLAEILYVVDSEFFPYCSLDFCYFPPVMVIFIGLFGGSEGIYFGSSAVHAKK